MKNLKLYEGFIENMKMEFAKVLDERKAKFDDCLQQLKDDYGVEYFPESITDIFTKSALTYINTAVEDSCPLTDEVVSDIIKTVKRLKQFEDIDVEGSFKLKLKGTNTKKDVLFSTNDWYNTPNPRPNQKRYIGNINDIKVLCDEKVKDLLFHKFGKTYTSVDYSEFELIVEHIEIVIC